MATQVLLVLALGLYSMNAEASWSVAGLMGLIDCVKRKNAASCEEKVDCNWCESTTIGTGCYPTKAAKILPVKYFTCDKPVDESAVLYAKASNGECDKYGEGDCTAPSCVWCTSAAVGGGCYTPDQAKLLPSAIFKCKTATTMMWA